MNCFIDRKHCVFLIYNKNNVFGVARISINLELKTPTRDLDRMDYEYFNKSRGKKRILDPWILMDPDGSSRILVDPGGS
jgi:hypothetical protein